MEAGRARNRDDNPGLPTLSLGLSSVRHIVTKLEAEYARVVTSNNFNREIVKYNPCGEDNDYYNYSFDTKVQVLNRFVVNLGVALSKCVPSVTLANFGFLAITTGLFAPRMISYLVVYPFCRLVFGTLYPAYASYKAVRTKNLKEYVKWMMYWIVFALFTCTETFTDVFLSWFPFYYEVKIVLVLWLLSPATKGSSILYRKFVHPALCRREQEIDEYIAKAKDQGYHTVLNLGTKGVNYATTVIMQTAIKGGGGLVQQIRKSYSLSDLTECEPREERGVDEADDVLAEPRLIRRAVKSGYATRRSASESNRSMYFPEVDVDVRGARGARIDEPDFSHIKSTEDISSGYSSAENSASLTRTASVGGRSRARTSRTTITTIKRPQAAEDNQVIIEELHDDDLDYNNMPPLINLTSPIFLSHTNPPFLYQYVGDQVKIIQVLGSYPLSNTNSQNNNSDIRDQKEASVENISPQINVSTNKTEDLKNLNDLTINNKDTVTDIPSEKIVDIKDNNNNARQAQIVELCSEEKLESKNKEKIDAKCVDNLNIEPKNDNSSEKFDNTTSVNITTNENNTVDSDDEISFGTPVSTPKSERKVLKGKYGKDKAPLPPNANVNERLETEVNLEQNIRATVNEENLNNEILVSDEKQVDMNQVDLECDNIVEATPIIKDKIDDSILECLHIDQNEHIFNLNNEILGRDEKQVDDSKSANVEEVTPINYKIDDNTIEATHMNQNENIFMDSGSEKNKRQKSKSPARTSKSTALGKLLQLPGKLAFWHKHDDKVQSQDAISDASRRSSENTIDEFQSCPDLPQIEITEPTPTSELPGNITKDILEKSDALQKAIEAKLEHHPEYKFVSLHADLDVPTTSKTTDV